MGFGNIMLILLTLAVLGVGGYVLFGEIDRTPAKVTIVDSPYQPPTTIETNYPESKQFFPNLRFKDRVISYNFDQRCDLEKEDQIRKALSLFENRTIVRFVPVAGKPDLFIACSEIAPEPENEGHFVAGEGGPTKILNGSIFTIILEGKISLYKNEECPTPHIAVHELLHVFGFDHNNDPNSVLYPTLDCNQVYNSYFFDRINELYRVESLADLAVTNVTLNKTGRYLNFIIEVSNYGLKDSNGVKLRLLADQEVLESFDLGEITVGTKKIFTVQNVRSSRSLSEIEFQVDPENKIEELSESNNKVRFTID